MSIVYNNKDIKDVYYGSTRIRQVYLGSKLIWERGEEVSSFLYSWGLNYYGQLGLGNTDTPQATPQRVGTASDWASVACGGNHTLAINSSGELWAWGDNPDGRLGLGDTAQRTTPVKVGTASDWASVACGDAYSIAIKTNGELWAWGNNSNGQLGLGDYGTGTDRTAPTKVGTASDWASVACGGVHSIAIKTNGELWAWGVNSGGQLGLGDYGTGTDRTAPTKVGTASDWASVACGGVHSIAIKTNGELWAWGNNFSGHLGLGDTAQRTAPTKVGTASDWASVVCGGNHTLAINSSGELWAWGNNSYGQLGLGNTDTPKTTPQRVGTASDWASVACGSNHTLTINASGELWAWGINNSGQLGLGDYGAGTNRTAPTKVGTDSNWASVACGGLSTIATRG